MLLMYFLFNAETTPSETSTVSTVLGSRRLSQKQRKKCKIWMTQPSEAQFKVSSLDLYSLARPMVWYCAVQRNSVTEVGIIAVLLPKVFSVTLLSR